MSDAQLDIHVKSSDDEHVYYGNSSSKDGDISVVPPTKQEGASVLSLLPRTGVSYIVWAYVSANSDLFLFVSISDIGKFYPGVFFP